MRSIQIDAHSLRESRAFPIAAAWYDCAVLDQLPLAYRAWVAYCRFGPKNHYGGTRGGTLLFNALNKVLAASLGRNRFVKLAFEKRGLVLVIDPYDIEAFIHTIPSVARGCPESVLIDRLLGAGDLFLDVGANHGMHTLTAAIAVGPEGKVIAVEANARLATVLASSLSANCFDHVQIAAVAASDRRGVASFFVPTAASGVGSLSRRHAQQSGPCLPQTVALETLDDIVRERDGRPVALIKLDIEGAETLALRGAGGVLRTDRPHIIVEVNPMAMKESSCTPAQLRALLTEFGYTLFLSVTAAAEGRWQAVDLDACNQLSNVLAVHAARADEVRRVIEQRAS